MQHQHLARGRWQELSLIEQMAHIGSEVGRAARWRGKDEDSYAAALGRALELLDMTLEDSRWRCRLKEIARARELLAGSALLSEADNFNTSLADLERYFFPFALAARLHR